MAFYFEGRKLAENLSRGLKNKVSGQGFKPKLVSIVVGDVGGSVFYQNLKKKKAAEVGIEVEIKNFRDGTSTSRLIEVVSKLNDDLSVNGVMLQIPLPDSYTVKERGKIIEVIAPEKDVDGMRDDSPYDAPVVRAVMLALEHAEKIVRPPLKGSPCKVVVLGHTGFEGNKLVKKLEKRKSLFGPNFRLIGIDRQTENLESDLKDADVIISATGAPDLIKPQMIKKGAILIDVGSPKGDIEKSAHEKASFVTPVPGGVGPLTVYYLLENLVESAGRVALVN